VQCGAVCGMFSSFFFPFLFGPRSPSFVAYLLLLPVGCRDDCWWMRRVSSFAAPVVGVKWRRHGCFMPCFFGKRNNILVGRILAISFCVHLCVCVCVQLLVVSLDYYDGKGPLCVR
jgi:hypothetical protein